METASTTPTPLADKVSLCLSMDEATTLLQRAHSLSISKDDPILCVVTLHNHFIIKFSELLALHHTGTVRALDAAFSKVQDDLSDEARVITEDFKAISAEVVRQLNSKAIENTLDTVGAHQKMMGQFLENVTAQNKVTRMYTMASVACLVVCLVCAAIIWLGK